MPRAGSFPAPPRPCVPNQVGLPGLIASRLLHAEHVVGVTGFEPATLCSQSRCATKLRYTPKDSCPMHHHTGADAKCRARGRLTLGSSVSPSGVRGCSSMVEPLPSKQITRVRFPSSAPKERHSGYKGFRHGQELSRVAFLLFCGGFGVLKPGVWCRGGASDGG